MLKHKSKLIFVLLVAVLLIASTFSFATETPVTTSADGNAISTVPGDNAKTTEGETPDTTTTDTTEIYDGDLYLLGNHVVMDKLVDGNVYISGMDVEITGKVNGNLFVMANKVTFAKGSYVVQSAYVGANELQFNGSAGDLYAFSNTMNMSYDGFVLRDLKVVALSSFHFNGGVGRDAFISASDFQFSIEEGNSAIIYGDLNYSSKTQLELSNTFVQGELKYSPIQAFHQETIQETIYQYAISFFNALLFTLVLSVLLGFLAPKFVEKTSSYISTKIFPAIGIGILCAILIPIASIMLMIIPVTSSIGITLLGIFAILLLISFAIVAITISTKLKEKFHVTKTFASLLILVATTLVLWILQQIPYVVSVVNLLLIFTAFGILFMQLFMKNFGTKKQKEDTSVKEIKKDNN